MDFLLVKLLSCVKGCYKEFTNKLPLQMWYAAKIDKIDKPNCDKVKTPFKFLILNPFMQAFWWN